MIGCHAHEHMTADPAAIVAALRRDDMDAALQAGLLDWPACDACAQAAGLDAFALQLMQQARRGRMQALEARQRYRERTLRTQQRALQRQRTAALSTSSLPSAAAAALARARAKASARNPD